MILSGLGALTLGNVISKLWKPLLIVAVIGAVGFFMYMKGRHDVAEQQAREVLEEVQDRYEEANKFRYKADKKERRYEKKFEAKPEDDARDSCILSGDPFNTDC